MRKFSVVLMLVAGVSGCAASWNQFGQWAKVKGEELRRLNEQDEC